MKALIFISISMLFISFIFQVLKIYLSRQKDTTFHTWTLWGISGKTIHRMLDVGSFIILWYALSIGMTLFNKWFLDMWEDGGFPFVTTMTCVNMIIKCILSRIINQCTKKKMQVLETFTYWKLAVPIGIFTAFDIMLSNWSFLYVTVTFYTIVKSGSNIWTLLFSICMGHQKHSWILFAVVVLISTGIALTSFGSTEFVFDGFLLVLSASILGTLRWVCTQSLLKALPNDSNRILAVVYYISPISAIALLPMVMILDFQAMTTSKFVHTPSLLLLSMIFILCGGCFAFVMIFLEILLVKKTSALSLGIAGSLKDVTQIIFAVLLFHDQLTIVNSIGLVIALSGMILYTIIQHSKPSLGHAEIIEYSSVKCLATHETSPTDTDIEDDAIEQLATKEKVISLDASLNNHIV